ncbi:IS66 family transposase [Salmonella enterica]|nr:IS66 family transposase [Salmonella enterica]
MFEEDVDADIAAIEANLKAQLPRNADEKKSPSSRPVRKPLPANLERVTRVIDPESTDCCPACQGELRHFRDEICEKLEYIPAKFVVNQYVRPQYSCAACEKVFSGQMPPHIIPKGIAESSLVAQVVISKYRDYQPLYRQQHIFARADIELPVSTMAGWVGATDAALAPLAALLHQTLLTRSVIHADETTLQILDTRKGGAARRGYLWSYVSGEKTGDAVVCFECLPGRSSKYPTSFLSGWSGHLGVRTISWTLGR